MGFSVSATLTSSQKILTSSLEHFDVVTRNCDAVSMNCMPSHYHLHVELQSCPVSFQIESKLRGLKGPEKVYKMTPHQCEYNKEIFENLYVYDADAATAALVDGSQVYELDAKDTEIK
ncbi:hypothetical protein Tco_0058845 [Tanacetum coccineum]